MKDSIYEYPNYTNEQHLIWEKLYALQYPNLVKYAHEVCINCLHKLNLPKNRIPDLNLVSEHLYQLSGWKIKPVTEMINYEVYFDLLSQKYFPSTYYIRSKDDFEISKKPDIFHELIGHVSMILDKSYRDFLQKIGLYALQAPPYYKLYLLRLVWYTTEVGLISTNNGIKIYGASILSSIKEISHAIENMQTKRFHFSLLDILRMPYEYDSLQSCYFVLKNFSELYTIVENIDDLTIKIENARKLGNYNIKEVVQNLLIN